MELEQREGESEKAPLPPPVDQAPIATPQPWIEIQLAGTTETVQMPTSGPGAANMTHKYSSNVPQTVSMGPPAPPVEWMEMPGGVTGCPSGLEYLALVDQVLIHQVVELFEIVTPFEMENKYVIKNSMGQQIYYAFEESEPCHRNCCGKERGFTLKFVDFAQQEVMRLVRPFKCCAGWPCCACINYCAYTIDVESPPGTVIGSVRQTISAWKDHLDILDHQGNTVLKVRGPCCPCQTICCTDDVNFEVKTTDLKNNIGAISKQWGGWVREMYTKADNFSMTFPTDLDVRTKATLMAAMFLIEFAYYERKKNRKS
ncbi:phospholipid scramblase 1-like [Diadema antillarum]|uniref:phospholipid scramblase 1-like n=1 Tax=Diadema antillarum TaxID=105358 RepID=UPI003A86E58A